MIILIQEAGWAHEIEHLCRLFFPRERIKIQLKTQAKIKLKIKTHHQKLNSQAQFHLGFLVTAQKNKTGLHCEFWQGRKRFVLKKNWEATTLRVCQMLFCLFRKAGNPAPPWGLLTGVRPVKLFRRLVSEMGQAAAVAYFRNRLWVSPKKIQLAERTATEQTPILIQTKPQSYSLYISIPFCPSRCRYCSFVSHTIDRASAQTLLPEYLEKLCLELQCLGCIAKDLQLSLESVYIGGGTPTSLSAPQLRTLLETLHENFPISPEMEVTCEAGRPDTITEETLAVLHAGGVNRISVNPQTMRDEILALVGRRHTTEQTRQAFSLSRAQGFPTLNMDLIAGLPGDCVAGFQGSLREVLQLRPENITVHTLALKRAADLTQLEENTGIEEMLCFAEEQLTAAGYVPYYLYRQSRSAGNLENVGWSLPGRLCRYNIDMMEESHSILSAGAGGVTKLKDPQSTRLERLFSLKFPYEYLRRFPEIFSKKKQIPYFYQNLK